MGTSAKKTNLTAEDRELIQSMKKQLIAMGVTDVKEQAQLIQQEFALRKNAKGSKNGVSSGAFHSAIEKLKNKVKSVSENVMRRTIMKDQPMLTEEEMLKMYGMSPSENIPNFDQNFVDEFGQLDESALGQHSTSLDGPDKKKRKEVSLD